MQLSTANHARTPSCVVHAHAPEMLSCMCLHSLAARPAAASIPVLSLMQALCSLSCFLAIYKGFTLVLVFSVAVAKKP